MRSRRVVAALLALSLLAAACGDDEDDDATSSNDPASEQTDESATEEAGPRTVEHAMGSTEVPAEPERVVVLDSSFLDASLRSAERRVGKECVSKCRYRWSPYHEKKKKKIKRVQVNR